MSKLDFSTCEKLDSNYDVICDLGEHYRSFLDEGGDSGRHLDNLLRASGQEQNGDQNTDGLI